MLLNLEQAWTSPAKTVEPRVIFFPFESFAQTDHAKLGLKFLDNIICSLILRQF